MNFGAFKRKALFQIRLYISQTQHCDLHLFKVADSPLYLYTFICRYSALEIRRCRHFYTFFFLFSRGDVALFHAFLFFYFISLAHTAKQRATHPYQRSQHATTTALITLYVIALASCFI